MRRASSCALALAGLAAADDPGRAKPGAKPLPPWKASTLTAWGGDNATGASGWSAVRATCSFTPVTDVSRKPPGETAFAK